MEEIYGVAAIDVVGRPLYDAFPFIERTEGPDIRRALDGEVLRPEGRSFPIPAQGRAGFFEAYYARSGARTARSPARSRSSATSRAAPHRGAAGGSEARFRTMADGAPVLLWMAGRDALCTFFNQGWLTFTGRTSRPNTEPDGPAASTPKTSSPACTSS